MKKLFLLSTAILSIASASYASMNQVKADEVPTVEQTDSNGKRVQVPATGYNSNEVRASNVRLLEIHDTPKTFKEMHSRAKHEVFERIDYVNEYFKSESSAKYSNIRSSTGQLIINDKYPVFNPKEYGLYEMDFDRGDGTAYRFKVDVRYNALTINDTYLMNIEIVNINASDNSTSASDTNNSTSASDTSNSASTSDTNNSTSTSDTNNSTSTSDTNNSASTSDTNNSASTSNSSANLGLSSTSASNSNASTSTDILATSSWMYSNGRWWYKHANGSYTTKAWEKIDGVWYYFDDEGWMQTGWVKDNGTWYYLSESGAMQTGWVKDNGVWYYLNQSGAMQTGWVKDNGTWYYLDGSGAMQTGWVKDGSWYYLDGSGAMQTGWVKDNDNWYYLQDSGAMKTGWMKVSDKWYYAYSSGALAINTTTPDGYYVDYNGEWL